MAGKIRIDGWELFSLMFLFEMGTAIVVGLGIQAKQDAWIAIQVGMVGGFGLIWMYCYMSRQFPGILFTDYLLQITGKWVGYPLALVYIVYFLYDAARDLRDMTSLLVTTVLNQTPIYVVSLIIMLLVTFALFLGLETFVRTAEIFVVVVGGFLLLGILLVFISNVFKVENLLPVLENGWKPVLSTAFPLVLTFPFGELVVFLMIFPYLNTVKAVTRIGFSVVIVSGLILSLVVTIDIGVLGVYRASASVFPLLQTLENIDIAHFIQRLDPLVIMILIIGGFFKITVLSFGAMLGLVGIAKGRKSIYFILGTGLVVWGMTFFIAKNFPQHLEIGLKIVPYYLHLPLQVGIPFLLLILVVLRKRHGKGES